MKKKQNAQEPTLEEIIQAHVYNFLEKRGDHLFYLYEGFESAAEEYDLSYIDIDEALEPFKCQLECILVLARETLIHAKKQHAATLDNPAKRKTDKKLKKRLDATMNAFRTQRINPTMMYLPKAPEYKKLKGKKHPKSVQLSAE